MRVRESFGSALIRIYAWKWGLTELNLVSLKTGLNRCDRENLAFLSNKVVREMMNILIFIGLFVCSRWHDRDRKWIPPGTSVRPGEEGPGPGRRDRVPPVDPRRRAASPQRPGERHGRRHQDLAFQQQPHAPQEWRPTERSANRIILAIKWSVTRKG